MAFLNQDSDTARTSGLVECAKAVNKTNLGRRLGNGSGARRYRVWIDLYITRGTEEE